MQNIVGSWLLVEVRTYDENGGRISSLYGPQPMGFVMYHPGGRMMCVVCDSRLTLPAGESEREYASYTGSYTYDGKKIVTQVDCTSNDFFLGVQERHVRFEDKHMILTPPMRLRHGKKQYLEFVWEKIAEHHDHRQAAIQDAKVIS